MTTAAAPGVIGTSTENRRPSRRRLLTASCALLVMVGLISIAVGPTGITLTALPRVLAANFAGALDAATAREQLVLIDIRLPARCLRCSSARPSRSQGPCSRA